MARMKWMSWVGVWVIGCMMCATGAYGQDSSNEVDALKSKLRDQERRIRDIEDRQAGVTLSKGQREEVSKMIDGMLKDAKSQMAGPSWLKDLKFFGDLRLRFEYRNYNPNSSLLPPTNSYDRYMERYRLRFGFEKTYLDKQMTIGFALASGEPAPGDGYSKEPTSTNQTWGQSFRDKPIWVDLAYAKYEPNWLKGFNITAGKMKNPWICTDMVWDTDVNPEGIWTQYKPEFDAGSLGKISPFAGVGWFIAKEVQGATYGTQTNHDDVYFFAYTAGVDWAFDKNGNKLTFGATYYDWNDYPWSGVDPNGNFDSHYASLLPNFQVIVMTLKQDIKISDKIPLISPYFEWAHNCNAPSNMVNTKTYPNAANFNDQNNGYAAGVKVGQNKKTNDWSVSYAYKYIEANAVPGYYNDSDFVFANRQGSVGNVTYNITDDITLGTSIYCTKDIDNPASSLDKAAWGRFTLMVDMVWKF